MRIYTPLHLLQKNKISNRRYMNKTYGFEEISYLLVNFDNVICVTNLECGEILQHDIV